MERRLFKRIGVGVKAEIILHGRTLGAVIEDLSEQGARIVTDPVEDAGGFVEGAGLELRFQYADEEKIALNGTIQWVRQAYPNAQRFKVGILLINPPWEESRAFI